MIKFIPTYEHHLQIPSKKSAMAAGYDIEAAEPVKIYPGQRVCIGTGWSWDATEHPNVYGQIAPRSGLAYQYGIDVLAGIIDADYEGEIKVILQNHGETPLQIQAGDRIAQLLIKPLADIETCFATGRVNSTERGTGAFGSTGL